jgi:hypothetical protein
VPEFGSNRLRCVLKGREVGVGEPSNLRLAADDQCSALWLGAEVGFDALHGTLVDTD